MIERIALFRLHPHVDRGAFAAQVRIELSAVSGLTGLSVGLPSDAAAEKSWDVSLVMRFENPQVAARALASDAFLRCQHDLLDPSAQVSKQWAFELLA
ncbi:MAG: hypothetical protein RL385_3606 [Pseudomonadota bacterium]|jgi:hypothetical protein